MNKNIKLKIDKEILKALVTFSIVLIAWACTLIFYMIFLQTYGTEIKIYDIGILAGATGGIWGYAMTKLASFRNRVYDMNEKMFYAQSFYYRLCIFNIGGIIGLLVLIAILHRILANLNV